MKVSIRRLSAAGDVGAAYAVGAFAPGSVPMSVVAGAGPAGCPSGVRSGGCLVAGTEGAASPAAGTEIGSDDGASHDCMKALRRVSSSAAWRGTRTGRPTEVILASGGS
jgi:hypothetical protein